MEKFHKEEKIVTGIILGRVKGGFTVDIDGATAFVYQYRGETTQYQLNFSRFEQGIKNMQSLLVNKYEYVRSTVIQQPTGYFSSGALT